MEPKVGNAAKKTYEPPKLHVYGDLAEMTKTGGTTGKSDKGGSGKHVT
jgi:hypothetical protein